jgi:SAM-dependent methyltransferase
MSVESNCPLCGSDVSDFFGYLNQMSWKGKLFGKLPGFIGQLMPVVPLKNRFVHGRKMISIFSEHQWAYCVGCNFSYVHPQITSEKLDDYYSSEYWSVRAPEELKQIVYAKENTERPTNQLQFLKKNGLTRVESMLDFGAGMCGAPTVFKRAKFCDDITIYDKSAQAKQIAGILGVRFVGDLDEIGDEQFDLIYSSHSLEHVPDILETLARLSQMVKKGGYLFFEVPNIANRTVVKLAHHAPHTYNFSETALCKALEMHGFKTVASEVYGVLVQDLISHHKDKDLEVPDALLGLFQKVTG